MIGRATASLHHGARGVAQRFWGVADIDTRLKWSAVWPSVARLPRTPLRVLDAGCGDGGWTIELAARRPAWQILGIDRDREAIAHGEHAARRLGLATARFLAIDFLDYQPDVPFDAILSVSAAHYLAADGQGPAMFAQFARWLAPGGRLILYGPRRRADVPAVRRLPDPFSVRDVFSPDDLSTLCRGAGLHVERLAAVVLFPGTLAKQLGRLAGTSPAARLAAYPWQLTLTAIDRVVRPRGTDARSSALLLVARRSGGDEK